MAKQLTANDDDSEVCVSLEFNRDRRTVSDDCRDQTKWEVADELQGRRPAVDENDLAGSDKPRGRSAHRTLGGSGDLAARAEIGIGG